MPEDPKELVEIYHPGLHPGEDPPVAVTNRQAFAETWKDKGYVLVEPAAAPGVAAGADAPPAKTSTQEGD